MSQEINTNTPKTPQKRDKIDLFKVKEFATASGIPYRGILAAIKAGELRCIRRNARWFRIRSEDAAKWVASLTESITLHKSA